MPSFKNYRGQGGLNLSINLEGLAAAQAGLESVPAKINEGFKMALRGWAEDVLARSQQLVPINTGRLKSTGQVNGPEMKNGVLEVHIGYGDRRSAFYAAIVHERLDVRHPHGQAKFLEIPLNENLKTLDAALTRVIETSLERIAKAA
jgi:hypothetical protein